MKEIVLEGLNHPWSIAFLSESEVLITEKDGNLVKADLDTGERIVVKGFPKDLVDSIRMIDRRDNSGIFDVVLHPEFATNNWVYLSYAAEGPGGTTTQVIRATLKEDSLQQVEVLFTAEPYTSDLFHYGGGMAFGVDHHLYFTIGERLYNEIDEPPLPIAQDEKDRRGKIYRLMDDGSIPVDNPDFGPDAVPGIFAVGIRAAQGITVDPETGTIWFSEHGSTQGDELNKLVAGANYGWPIQTTGAYRNPYYVPPVMSEVSFTSPTHFWQQTIAPTGLVSYHGTEFPQWDGDLILAGLSRGSLWRIYLVEDEVISIEELFIQSRVRSRKVALSPAGTLYMLTDEEDGKLLRIVNDN